MGEATYYMKMRLHKNDGEDAWQKTSEEIMDFFIEGARAYEFWQTNRGFTGKTHDGIFNHESPGVQILKEGQNFWTVFRNAFPQVYDYLKGFAKADGDYNNDLAGLLDFGTEDEVERRMERDEDELRYSAYVWHFADWTPLAEYIRARWKAEVKWISDEYADPFELL